MAQSQQNTQSDGERRRQLCTSSAPKKVLIKFTGIDLGLPRVQRTIREDRQRENHHTVENLRHGLEVRHDRPSTEDSGHCAIRNLNNVSLESFVAQLAKLGYVLTDCHSFVKPGNGRLTNVLEFTLKGKAIETPKKVAQTLAEHTFDGVFAWCNLKTGQAEKPDTINGFLCTHNGGCGKRFELKLTTDHSYART